MTNNIPQIMTLSANNIFEYCEKKKIKVDGGAFMGSKVIDALLNDERGIK